MGILRVLFVVFWGLSTSAVADEEADLKPSGEISHHVRLSKTELIWTATKTPACVNANPPCMAPSIARSKTLPVIHVESDRCGVVRYLASVRESQTEADRFPYGRPIWSFLIEDHRDNRCAGSPRRLGWRITMWDTNFRARTFSGEPRASAPDCSEVNRDLSCAAFFAPAQCQLGDLRAEGSNSCVAMANLRTAACEKGLDWETMDFDEAMCSVTMCPIPMCAAPPEGCRYEPDPNLPTDRCAVSCGILVCDPT